MSFGIDPRGVRGRRPQSAQVRAIEARARLLVEIAERPLQWLRGVVRHEAHIVALADQDGNVVRLHAPASELDATLGISEGISWNERNIGNNGIGTAIETRQAVLIRGPEHFAENFQRWSCLGIPLWTPDGAVIGAIDVSMLTERANELVFRLALSVAESIQSDLQRVLLLRSFKLDFVDGKDDPFESLRDVMDELIEASGPTHFDLEVIRATRQRFATAEQRIRSTFQALSEARLRMEDRDRRKDSALAGLWHELRNPLNVAAMLLEVLEHSKDDPARIAQIVNQLRHQTRALARLVADMSDVARLEEGAISMQKEFVNLNDVTELALAATRPDAESRSHHVTVRLSGDPITVFADPGRLEQVLINLLTNAAKYTPYGGTIVVESERTAGQGIVRVRDTGIGIAPENLVDIFDEFRRAAPSSGDPGGLGLGLAIVKRLVRLHGGTVTASSAGVGKGSEFEIRLPLHAPSQR